MRQKDISEKMLISYDDVFADIIDFYFFDGKNVVKENELEQAQEVSAYKEDGKLYELRRDELKNWKKAKLRISAFGIENQSEAEREAPIRIIGYDGATYRSQLAEKKKAENEPAIDTQHFYPVYSLILYFGKTRWKNNRKLSDIIEFPEEHREEMMTKFNDYSINVLEVAFLEDEEIAKFKSDFRLVAEYFVNRRKNPGYEPSPDEIRHVDAVLTLLRVMTGDKRFEEMINAEEGAKPKNMCEVLDYRENRGYDRGNKDGYNRGNKDGYNSGKQDEMKKVAAKLHEEGFDRKKIAKILEISLEELDKME